MKVTFKHGVVEIEMDNVKDAEEAWSKVGFWQYVFFCSAMCGNCQSTRTYLSRRPWDKGDKHYVFFSACCYDCEAKLDFWPPKDGRGFEPKRKNEDGGLRPNDGWVIYQKKSWSRPYSDDRSFRAVDTAKTKTKTNRKKVDPQMDMHTDGSDLLPSEISF